MLGVQLCANAYVSERPRDGSARKPQKPLVMYDYLRGHFESPPHMKHLAQTIMSLPEENSHIGLVHGHDYENISTVLWTVENKN